MVDELAKAKERFAIATHNQLEQSPAYERDPLFMYLWHNGWGTSRYQGRGLVRLLDGWVAGICDFGAARQSYWLLNEVPERLRKHIRALEDQTPESAH